MADVLLSGGSFVTPSFYNRTNNVVHTLFSTHFEPPPNVVNLSQRTLTQDEYALLALGTSFIPTPSPRKFDPNTLVGDFRKLRDTYITKYTHSITSLHLPTQLHL